MSPCKVTGYNVTGGFKVAYVEKRQKKEGSWSQQKVQGPGLGLKSETVEEEMEAQGMGEEDITEEGGVEREGIEKGAGYRVRRGPWGGPAYGDRGQGWRGVPGRRSGEGNTSVHESSSFRMRVCYLKTKPSTSRMP
uniref:Uncharacterized protein n=1 Tax=Chromera velia CCMP2878 TaxID=1169474 RepID=A0A0G4G322_9ALVE|eukprot:Cvel_19883.t1-p1 / transcript=Cvel_19883.t1 / gene=Cvel_19883 / organism=Chromera_velia_CCMP2878 / gene_product=hypothetical protein / transcript_product=hypothetical protein / location=Cvel_scaffold1745:2567-4687(+) / protein_length=135 / sequence_SO=supercontig / SO=protein_coding / is_pseudo=false